MVSSIVPGASNTNAGRRHAFRTAQPQRREDAVAGDKVELSSAAISGARSVRSAMAQVHEALAAGHDAQAMLVKPQIAHQERRSAGVTDLLSAFAQRVDSAIGRGAFVLAGQDVGVQAEPRTRDDDRGRGSAAGRRYAADVGRCERRRSHAAGGAEVDGKSAGGDGRLVDSARALPIRFSERG